MAKGYWIVRVDVHDPEEYKGYVAAAAEAFKKFGAHFMVRGGPREVKEGSAPDRHVVIEFADVDTAHACYNSPEYTAAKAIRNKYADADFVIVEGYDGPQPS